MYVHSSSTVPPSYQWACLFRLVFIVACCFRSWPRLLGAGGGVRTRRVNDPDSGSWASDNTKFVYYRNWANLYSSLPASQWISSSQLWHCLLLNVSLHCLIQCQWSLTMQTESRLAQGGSTRSARASLTAGPAERRRSPPYTSFFPVFIFPLPPPWHFLPRNSPFSLQITCVLLSSLPWNLFFPLSGFCDFFTHSI